MLFDIDFPAVVVQFLKWLPLICLFLSSQGRNPFFLEPAIIIAITDGNKLTGSSGVQDEVSHNLHRDVGSQPIRIASWLTGWQLWSLSDHTTMQTMFTLIQASINSSNTFLLPVTMEAEISLTEQLLLQSPTIFFSRHHICLTVSYH